MNSLMRSILRVITNLQLFLGLHVTMDLLLYVLQKKLYLEMYLVYQLDVLLKLIQQRELYLDKHIK